MAPYTTDDYLRGISKSIRQLKASRTDQTQHDSKWIAFLNEPAKKHPPPRTLRELIAYGAPPTKSSPLNTDLTKTTWTTTHGTTTHGPTITDCKTYRPGSKLKNGLSNA